MHRGRSASDDVYKSMAQRLKKFSIQKHFQLKNNLQPVDKLFLS